jgi:(p)ppGpp synthase/HD superfamily hydrolase
MSSGGGRLSPLEHVPTAQSSVGLFNQLQAQHVTAPDLRAIRAAHAWAMSAFAGRMHPSGKPYLDHCIGAASVLAGLGVCADVVAGGLVHGAYRWGDFGPWRVFFTLKRRRLAADLGAEVEAHAYQFEMLPWSPAAVIALRDTFERLDRATRTAVLMRLASDLDNMRDRAHLFCDDAEQRRVTVEQKGAVLVDLADRLGFPALARALQTAVTATLAADVPASLRWQYRGVALIPPGSARRKPEAVLASMIASRVRRMRHTKLGTRESGRV